MKPLFGIDLTDDKKNTQINGREFIISTVSAETAQRLEEAGNAVETVLKETKLPLWIRIVKSVCGFIGVILLVSLLNAALDIGFVTALQKVPYFVVTCVICILVWGILTYFENKKQKEILEEDKNQYVLSSIDQNIQNAYDSLHVPRGAADVDVLIFYYKMKGNKLIPCPISSHTDEYINIEMKIYAENGNLCLADTENLYAIPLSSLESIQTVKKRIPISSWNKEESFNKGIYKPYKLVTDNVGRIIMKSYHILTFKQNDEIYGLYFPCYELAQFEKQTGLQAS